MGEEGEEREADEIEEERAEDLLIIAGEYLAEEKYEEAIEVYKEIVKKNPIRPTLAKACNDCGVAYASLEQYEMAIGFFNAALNLKDYLLDEGISACYNLGLVYKTMGDAEKSEQYFKRAEMIKREYKRRIEEAQGIFSSDVP